MGIYEPGTYPRDLDDEAFEIAMESLVPSHLTDKRFHVKIAGASHQNADGTRRRPEIAKCIPLEKLDLIREPNNPYSSNATGVWTPRRKQIGYLDSRLASEVVSQQDKWGAKWEAYFCKPTIHQETGKVAGCILYLVRYQDLTQ